MPARVSILELRSVRGIGGGPEKTILLGAEQRDRSRFAVTVCYLRDRRDTVFAIGERAARMDVDYVEVPERHSFDLRSWRDLAALVRDRRIDIVHAHDYKTDLLALFLARRRSVLAMATAHGWAGESFRERFLYYPCDKRILAKFRRVIAVSTDIKRTLLRHGAPPDRTIVVLNAIDPAVFRRVDSKRDLVRRQLGFSPNDVVVGAVGRLEREKRFDCLMEAIAPLFARNTRLRLAIVGDGSLREELAAVAKRLDLGDRCHFLGHRSDVIDLHHAFDLFVQSSEREGTPNAVLEAMAMETPLIATDVGGTRELAAADIHGILVPKHDVVAMRTAIERVLADPADARRRASAARQRVESELSFEARTRRLEGIYEDLVRERDGIVASRAPAHA
jgi:glycosyltransferase involved in cell wall biosynthesis